MLREPRTINVDPDSELGQLLDEASKTPLILKKNGVRYLLNREDENRPISNEEYQRILEEAIGS